MKTTQTYGFVILMVLFVLGLDSCKSSNKGARSQKPDWVAQRPVSSQYYVGIGYASKLTHPADYQQIAKKNALNDLVGEIKVTVSTNSILSQFQNNQDFRQQFAAYTRITAQASVEDFQVVDSWENKEDYWIYYRLSKSEYEAARKRRLQRAINQSLDYLERSDQLSNKNQFMQKLRMRIKALAVLQNYLNEDVETWYKDKKVYLVNEIMSLMQDQLYLLQVRAEVNQLKAKVGKPLQHPFGVKVWLSDTSRDKVMVPFVPLTMQVEQGKMDFGPGTVTGQDGEASFSIARILAKDPVQQLRVRVDMEAISKTDSLASTLRNILMSLDAPGTNIRLLVEPIRVYMNSNELNLGKKMEFNIVEPALKKSLAESGCEFVTMPAEADYEIRMQSNTTDLGVMWGKMLQSTIDLSISIIDMKNKTEVFKDALKGIRGFQLTPEKAGLNSYDEMMSAFWKQVYPKLKEELLLRDSE